MPAAPIGLIVSDAYTYRSLHQFLMLANTIRFDVQALPGPTTRAGGLDDKVKIFLNLSGGL
jgi:hypothetical protein